MPALLARRQTVVFVVVIDRPYNIRSLYADRDVGVTSDGICTKSSGSGLSIFFTFEHCVAVSCLCGFSESHDRGVSDS